MTAKARFPSKVLILAAGFGTRLKALGQNLPKGLLQSQTGETLIARIIADVQQAFQTRNQPLPTLALVTNQRFFTQYQDFFANQLPELELQILNDGVTKSTQRLGALGDLLLAVKQLGWFDQDVLVLSSDNFYSYSVGQLLDLFSQKQTFVTVARHLTKEQIKGRFGCYVLGKDGLVKKFVEKPAQPPSEFAGSSFYIYPQEVWPVVKKYQQADGDLDAPGAIIPWLLKQGVKVYALVLEPGTLVIDVGTPADVTKLAQASSELNVSS
ncbi:MAG: NTP transferase domain-containing protein [Candidatus Pacebacteria bacterium]|nr:NTP transferase domain-containing protein [Candidatus Paceibacterota bacterium]